MMTRIPMFLLSAIALAAVAFLSPAASAAIVPTTTVNGNFNGFAVNTVNDLILQGAPTLAAGQPTWSASFDSYAGSSPSVLNDGNNHTGENSTTTAVSAPSNADWTLTYNLNTTSNTRGYSISEIDTDAVWTNDYAGQSYTLSYTPVGGTLTTVGTYSVLTPQPPTGNNPASTQITLTSNTSMPILTDVASLQFVFHGAAYNGGFDQGAYTQIVVTGLAVPAPEPSSIVALCGLGAMGLFLLVRRRRKA
jgi:hypothetical protein